MKTITIRDNNNNIKTVIFKDSKKSKLKTIDYTAIFYITVIITFIVVTIF